MSQFTLPKGYVEWCHICGHPPANKVTEGIPGVGFKTYDEARKHDKDNLNLHQLVNQQQLEEK
jgi:hypothetical protein